MTRRVPPLREINGYFKGADADVLGRCAFVFLRYRGEALWTDREGFSVAALLDADQAGFDVPRAFGAHRTALEAARHRLGDVLPAGLYPRSRATMNAPAYGLT